MIITDRDISKAEYNSICEDFIRIEIKDNIPQKKQVRHQCVAEENGEIIGYASGLTNHRWFFLTDLWVHENHRRKGLGSSLLKMLEAKAVDLGLEHIYTWTSGFINPLFYEKQGYRVFALLENFFEVEGYHHIGYRKDF